MQFPVPQFTDVEDKIIGSLTIKQFGILFGAGVLVFLAYSATKSLAVGIIFLLLFGLPAMAVAFGKINGRPMYTSFGYFTKFLLGPKVLVFHKEATGLSSTAKLHDANFETKAPEENLAPADPRARLREVNALLAKQLAEEEQLSEKIH